MKNSLRSLFAVVSSLTVLAAPASDSLPATGLGQSWPAATDVSADPHYHVYVFERDGIRYVQVNDAGGAVLGAVMSTGGSLIGLPMGKAATDVATVESASRGEGVGTPVYRDAALTLSVVPQADGTSRTQASQSECKNPRECSVGSP